MADTPRTDLHLLRRVFREARPFLPPLLGVLLLELLGTPLSLLAPVPLKVAVDSIIHHRPVPAWMGWMFPGAADTGRMLLWVCAFSLLIAVASQLQNLASSVLTTHASQSLLRDFRCRLFHHAEKLPLTYHSEKGTADTLYRIQNDATALEWLFVDGAIPLITSAFSLAAMLFVIFRLSWKVGCTALVVTPLLFLLTRTTRPLLRRRSRDLKKQESASLGIVHEAIGVLRVVKAFGQEDRERDRYRHAADQCVRGRVRLAVLDGALGLLINLLAATGVTAVLYFGVKDVMAGALTVGQMLLIVSYVSQLYAPLKTFSRKSVSLQAQLAGAERAFALLDLDEDVRDPASPRPLERARGAVSFRDVTYSYDGKRNALDSVSFDVEPGARVGIVGQTGAGKTTLTYLLTRFDDPVGGAVLLDGVDIREYGVADLRSQFAMVFQEPVLFATSIAENIAYARPGAHMDEIVAAAQHANVHDFVVSLPDGYDTLVGERGMALSGGERQRIGLARAFLRDSPILILDEPTSSVDVATESSIMEAVERLMANRTTFIIAHRLNTLVSCDKMLRVEGGRVTEELSGPAGVPASAVSVRAVETSS